MNWGVSSVSSEQIQIWNSVARHLDRTEKRQIVEFLAASRAPVPVGKLRVHTFGDHLLLESLIGELVEAGLLSRIRRPDGWYIGLSRTAGLRDAIGNLPEYYTRLQHRPSAAGKPRPGPRASAPSATDPGNGA